MYFSDKKALKVLFSEPKLFLNYYVFWGGQVAYMKIMGRKRRPKKYAHNTVMSLNQGNEKLKDLIKSGKPFMAGRFGSNELALTCYSYFNKKGYLIDGNQLPDSVVIENCGFFPKEKNDIIKFGDITIESIKECDFMCVWYNICEDYFIKNFGKKDISLTHRKILDFWNFDYPWTGALAGKKVLVIHPLDKLIEEQYKNKDKILPKNILPDFELKTLKAVQTVAGTKDKRFDTWFEALDYMYEEAMKIDFDIAIIGCGAYGYPLAAKIKKKGKQAIHMGGVTQILFGIKGNRWENDAEPKLMELVNSEWKKPDMADIPQNAQQVEGSCYW